MAPMLASSKRLVAQVVETDYGACAFCQRTVNDEIGFGKLYSIGKIYCHYFCVLLSCCLVQKGQDDEGLLGFLYKDILTEVERSKKHKCSYCGREGATLGCSVSQCRKQFHLPCGREHRAVSMFYGNYKSFCEKHAPRQQIDRDVMSKAKLRMSVIRKKRKALNITTDTTTAGPATEHSGDNVAQESDAVCVICYESVDGFPSTVTFWPPCCARDAWFHRTCLERMALSAGAHYLKCPLCNDKDNFYKAVVSQGYYLPDRDASWELDQNAYRDMYEREVVCRAELCMCPHGRTHDDDTGEWDIKLCVLCGDGGAHRACLSARLPVTVTCELHVCAVCLPVAPADLDQLRDKLAAVILQEESRPPQSRSGPVMPSRMSLRRTKPVSLTSKYTISETINKEAQKPDQKSSRSELNLKSPKKPIRRSLIDPNVLNGLENKLLSPIKMLEEKLYEKMTEGVYLDCARVVEMLRAKFKKPSPLSEKRKIVNAILNEILKEAPKVRTPLKECNPINKHDDSILCLLLQTSPQKQKLENIPNTQDASLNRDYTQTKTPEKSHLNDENQVKTPIKYIEEESNSTFELPSEFVAEQFSDDSLTATPNKSKAIEIMKDSSMEISANNQQINIDLVQIPSNADNSTKNRIKLSPMNTEDAINKKMKIDMECFKSHYLNEVNKDYKCNFNHKHENPCVSSLYSSTIQFAINAALKTEEKDDTTPTKAERKALKRKLKNKERRRLKKRKLQQQKLEGDEKYVFEYEKSDNSVKIKLTYKQLQKREKKSKANLSIRNRDIKFKIKMKESPKPKKNVLSPERLTQTILKLSPAYKSPKDVLVKPDHNVTPLKKKYDRHDKSNDSFKQTSLHSFFKSKSPSV